MMSLSRKDNDECVIEYQSLWCLYDSYCIYIVVVDRY